MRTATAIGGRGRSAAGATKSSSRKRRMPSLCVRIAATKSSPATIQASEPAKGYSERGSESTGTSRRMVVCQRRRCYVPLTSSRDLVADLRRVVRLNASWVD